MRRAAWLAAPAMVLATLLPAAALARDHALLTQPDPELVHLVQQAAGDTQDFEDDFDRQVWLSTMSGRMVDYVPDPLQRTTLLMLIHKEATRAKLPPQLVLSVIQVESKFDTYAVSKAGAVGLMQIMPRTARWIARQMPVRPYHPDMLVRPDVNVAMGSYYLHRVLEALGDPILATAAYNAGPARARRWRDAKPLEGAIYAETIPFPETRDYVKKVFTNAWYYRSRLTGATASLKTLLGTVPGADAGDSVAANIP